MSFQKINNLLSGGEIINYSLMSEQLKSTLLEVSNILQEQNKQIATIQQELQKRASINDFETFRYDINTQIQNNNKEQQEKNNETKNNLEKIEQKITEMQNINDNNIQTLREEVLSDISAKEKDISGDLFVLKQQICEINVKLIGQDSSIQRSLKDIQKINKLLDVEKDKSLELVALRVESCENRISAITSESTTYQKDTENKIEDLAKFANAMKLDFTNEIHAIEVGIKDVRHMVVDAPVIETDGQIDTPSLIRAIQRDSRRIDNFNETINSVRDDQKILHTLCTSLLKGFNDFQVNMAYLVTNTNAVKKDLVKKTNDNERKVLNISKEVVKLYNTFNSSIQSFMGGISQTSNVIGQITDFLSRVTNRQMPQFLNFDDCLIELQQQSDVIVLQNEKYEEKVNNEEKEISFEQTERPDFKLPFIVINTPDEKINKEVEFIQIASQKEVPKNEQQVNVTTENALGMFSEQSMQDLHFKLDNINITIDNMKTIFDEKLEKKADTNVMERYIDRNRLSINKLRDKVNEVVNDMSSYVKRSDMKGYSLESDTGRHSEFSTPFIKKPATAFCQNRAQKTIPRIKRNIETPHNVIYGCETPPRRQIPTFNSKNTI